jgi:hypothetical protein
MWYWCGWSAIQGTMYVYNASNALSVQLMRAFDVNVSVKLMRSCSVYVGMKLFEVLHEVHVNVKIMSSRMRSMQA